MNKLTARVNARNRCHAIANEIQPILRAALEPFVGKKVKLATSYGYVKPLQEKLNSIISEFNNRAGTQIYSHNSVYSLCYVVKVWEQDDKMIAHYQECSVYFGELNGLVLNQLSGGYVFQTDYSAEKIAELRQKASEIQRQLDAVKSQYHLFGEYDN